MSPPEYADAALEYVQAKGWTTNITELKEGAYLISGARETDSGSEEMLLMVICEPMTEIEAKHLKYLVKTGREKNVDSAKVTYTGEITEGAKEIGKSYNIGVIGSEKIRSHSEASEFDVDADDISMPNPDTDTQENPSQASSSKQEVGEGKGLDEETEGQAAEAEDQEKSASGTEYSSTAGDISEDRVDTQDSQSSYSDSEDRNEEIETGIENPPPTKEIKANYSQSNGRSVGGKLTLGDKYLHFKPHSLDKLLSADEIKIFYRKVVGVGTKDRFSGGLKDTLFGGGLRNRLKVETQDGDEFLFVVSNLGDIVDDVESRVQRIKTAERAADTDRIEPSNTREGGSTDQDVNRQGKDESIQAQEGQTPERTTDHNTNGDSEDWDPSFPILSVFAAMMTFQLSNLSIRAGRPGEAIGIIVLAVLIIPRVRKHIDKMVRSLTEMSLQHRVIQIGVGIVYAILIFAGILRAIGAGAIYGSSPFSGFISVPIYFMFAVLIVYLIRFVRRFT